MKQWWNNNEKGKVEVLGKKPVPAPIRPTTTISIVKKVKVKFFLQQSMKVQRGSRGIALLFL
jgi:hypothetical protein